MRFIYLYNPLKETYTWGYVPIHHQLMLVFNEINIEILFASYNISLEKKNFRELHMLENFLLTFSLLHKEILELIPNIFQDKF